jgi:hypothetical protein
MSHEVPHFNQTPPEILLTQVDGLNAIHEVNAYHAHFIGPPLQIDSFAEAPLPEQFRARYEGIDEHFTRNTAIYPEPLEDQIAEDPLVAGVIARRRERPNDTDLTDALRTRRTVLACLLHNSDVRVPEIPSQREPAEIIEPESVT